MTKEALQTLPIKSLPQGIFLQCSGTYYAEYRGHIEHEPFKTYVLLASDPNTNMDDYKNNLLSHLQNNLIDAHLRADAIKYPHFYKCRECKIIKIIMNFPEMSVGPKPVKLTVNKVMDMTMDELKTFVFQTGLSVEVDKFPTIFKARTAVLAAHENKKIKERMKRKAANIKKITFNDKPAKK